MPGRTFDSPDYRYGFNGKEKMDEVTNNSGATYDFGARIYDARLGRFMSVDPLAKNFAWNSPYAYAENRPIDGIDLDGKEWTSTSTKDPVTGITTVTNTVKIQIVNNSGIEQNSEAMQQLISDAKTEFAAAFTQDKKRFSIL